MWNEFGEFHYLRQDLHIPAETGMRLLEELAVNPPDLVGNKKVKDVRTLDGVKLILEPDAWILFRRSGTEPVLRIYCESPEVEDTRRILAEGRKLVEQFRPSGVSSM
jgi:phosphomannomutase